MIRIIVLLVICFQSESLADYAKPGPSVKPTAGEVWPKPVSFNKTGKEYFKLDPKTFKFEVTSHNCDILENAIARYANIISNSVKSLVLAKLYKEPKTLNMIRVNLKHQCETLPHAEMDESYEIFVSAGVISANSVWGILRALETFSQLVTPSNKNVLVIADVQISDSPRFPYRGLMLDTSRHYITIEKILRIIDGMSFNKLNVFHWHMVDDQSFPYKGDKYPELGEKGAYHSHMIYTKKQVAAIIEYARLRGIRVIPEFDVPGHSASWGVSHPELLTKCYGKYEGQLGPMNPISNKAYAFIEDFFNEITMLFPDKAFHLGGDEVDEGCWESNQDIIDYVKINNLDYPDLGKIFVEKLSKYLQTKEKTTMVWQEAVFDNIQLPNSTIVEVWYDWKSVMSKLTAQGYKVLLTECWYLHVLDTGGDWEKFYKCEPESFSGSKDQRNLIVGGEAAMWTEVVNDYNVIQRIFPRASAVAERLWSAKNTKVGSNLRKRLEEHVCRMILRRVESQPANDPGFC